MNIRQILDTIKKPFGKGEKFEKYAPAVNAFDTFFYLYQIILQNTELILEMPLI
jgi:Na+-transporting NADH:ubiquinone oxidoreductase subunit NqrB